MDLIGPLITAVFGLLFCAVELGILRRVHIMRAREQIWQRRDAEVLRMDTSTGARLTVHYGYLDSIQQPHEGCGDLDARTVTFGSDDQNRRIAIVVNPEDESRSQLVSGGGSPTLLYVISGIFAVIGAAAFVGGLIALVRGLG